MVELIIYAIITFGILAIIFIFLIKNEKPPTMTLPGDGFWQNTTDEMKNLIDTEKKLP